MNAKQERYIDNNGFLLKSDFHTLFDGGYITIDESYRIDMSRRLHEDYGNGRDCYKYPGQKQIILQEKKNELPSKKFVRWHNENVFLAWNERNNRTLSFIVEAVVSVSEIWG